MSQYDALRREYNAAVANGLILRARRIARQVDAIERKRTSVTPPVKTCPRLSPESQMPCELSDCRESHKAGHEGKHPTGYVGWTVSWATDAEDVKRWGE